MGSQEFSGPFSTLFNQQLIKQGPSRRETSPVPVKTGSLIIHLFSAPKCPVVFIRMDFDFKSLMKKKKKRNHTCILAF